MTEPIKIDYSLMPVLGEREVHKVLTSKLADHRLNEWRNNTKWSNIISNLKYHLSEFESGNDYDTNKLLHIAHVASDAILLSEMYSCYPQGDDRILQSNNPIICCDLDDVIFSFTECYEKRFGVKLSDYWNGDYAMGENLKQLQQDKDFWVNMPVKNIVPFEVDYYVTARSIPLEWTMEAIQKNNLPKAKVISLPWNVSKIDTLKELKCDIMLDDKYQTFKECKENGIFCYLISTPANAHYDVGHHRIDSLDQLRNLK